MVPLRRELILLAMLLGAGCGANGPSSPTEVPQGAPSVVLPDGAIIVVEVVADPESRARGLMHRPSLRDDRGMIFLFPATDVHSFWMKDTLIPLDMIWIDESQRVVDVKANVPPCQADPCPSYTPAGPSRYVLELAAGVAGQHQVVPGAKLELRNIIGQYIVR